MIVAGFQIPEIPFGEVVFKTGAAAPLHKVNVVAKSGIIVGFTVTFKVIPEAHCPEFGVKT